MLVKIFIIDYTCLGNQVCNQIFIHGTMAVAAQHAPDPTRGVAGGGADVLLWDLAHPCPDVGTDVARQGIDN